MNNNLVFAVLSTVGLTVAAVTIAVPAPAQVFGNHNSNAPVDFNAGRIEVQDRADRVVLSGAVRVEQAGLVLNASRMTVAYSNSGGIDVNRIDASGGVTIQKAVDTARGDVAIYDLNRRLITLVGGVTLQQGNGNRISGGRVIIDLSSGRSTIDGRSAGTANPGTTGNDGRVSGTFTVPQRKKQ